uniref:Uncharacterized protein n=1 Tax=Avena sativa TaxID=4498 RepID=A0ACD5V042_AVESA
MMLETAAAAVAALVLLTKTLMAAVSAASPTPSIGLSGCVTSCGDVAVPFPFGIGPAANCSLPGFNLTCDDDRGGKGPPRLLLGDLQVKDIDLDYCLMTVIHSGDTRISGSGGTLFGGSLPEDGPYRLASQNELTVLSCDTAATLRSGNITMSGCFTFCEAGYGSLDHPFSTGCNGMGCCRAPIVTNHRDLEAAEGKLEVHITWLGPGLNRSSSTDLLHVLVAEEGWFDQHFGSDVIVLEPPDVARVPVPLRLEWEVVGAVPDTNDSDTTRDCIGGPRGGYRCICNHGYQGNPYIPHGCQDIDECEHPEKYMCFGQCNNKQGSFDCSCPPGTRGNPEMPGGCVNSSNLTGRCNRLCGNILVPYPFGIEGTRGPASCYMPGFNLTCDTTSHGPARLLLGNHGFFRVTGFDLHNSAVRVVHSGPIVNTTSGNGEAFYFEGEGTVDDSEPRIFERTEVPYSLSTRNELILMGCNAMATIYEDDRDETIISGCASFCPDNVTDSSGYTEGMRSCYGTGCCQARISMSTNGLLPSVVGYQQIDKNRSPMPANVLIAEEGWFDSQQNFSSKSQSVAAQDVPMLLQWEVLPLPGLPKPDAKSHPNCTQEVDAPNTCLKRHKFRCWSMSSYPMEPCMSIFTSKAQVHYHGTIGYGLQPRPPDLSPIFTQQLLYLSFIEISNPVTYFWMIL